MKISKKVIIPVAVLVILVAGGVLLGNKGFTLGKDKMEDIPASTVNKVSVKVQPATSVEKASGITYKASLEASEEGIASSKIGGKVVQILFENGKYVSRNEPLVKLDDQDLRNNLRSAESQLNAAQAGLLRAEANLETSQRNFDRKKTLVDNGGATQADFENAESALKAAKADLESAKANINTAQVSVENLKDSLASTTVSAPISGVMDEKSVNLGQYVNPGTILGKVKNITPIDAVIEVEQNNLNYIKIGQKAQVKVGESNGKVFEGTVKSMDVSANPSSRVFKCKIQVDNKEQLLKPGIFAKVEITNDQKINITAVPIEALAGNEGNYYVFVDDNGIARKRTVTIGETIQNLVEINSGVQKGDRVICTNINTLQDGDAITVVSE